MANNNTINGIDVSECKYYDDGTCCNEDVLALSCDKTDCIYKQLKRLQEENEDLKEKIKSEKYIKENALQEATKYSMKCGEFRQVLKDIRDIIEMPKYTCKEFLYIRGKIDEVLKQ